VAGSTVSDMKVIKDLWPSLEWMRVGIEWAIKLVMLGVYLLWPYWQTFNAASPFCTKPSTLLTTTATSTYKEKG
jgi:ammonia channel protein AmtB